MRVMVVFSSINKIEDIKETWKKNKNGLKWKYAYNERRLILYNGHKIFDKDYERISNKCNKIINNTDGEILILVHASSKGIKDMFNKINLNSSHISNKKVYTLYSHLYEKEGLIGSLADAIKGNDGSEWKQAFDKLWSSCIKGESQEEINEILRLFLPLDIDMQAIKVLINEKKDLEQAEAYLKDMLTESTNYHKSILNNYGERFNKLLYQVEDQKSKEKVQAVLGMGEEEELKIKDLLERISNLKSNDIEKEFFNNSQNNQLKTEIISFHSWYEKLARTLSEL